MSKYSGAKFLLSEERSALALSVPVDNVLSEEPSFGHPHPSLWVSVYPAVKGPRGVLTCAKVSPLL